MVNSLQLIVIVSTAIHFEAWNSWPCERRRRQLMEMGPKTMSTVQVAHWVTPLAMLDHLWISRWLGHRCQCMQMGQSQIGGATGLEQESVFDNWC